MDFDAPGTADYFEIKKYVGALTIIAVNEYLPEFTTSMGPGKAVRAEVVVLDGPHAGDRYEDALFFGKKIVPQMNTKVGSVMLGRITQGQARPGQSAPYQLAAATSEDAKLANAWVKANGTVESKPTDTSATGHGYAPDNGDWKAQHQARPDYQAQQAGPPAAYPGTNGGQMPTPPAAPPTYVTVPADDDAPF